MTLLFGLTRLFIGIGLGAYAFGFKKPKEGWITKYPVFVKVLSVICILSGLYSIFFASPDTYSLDKNAWTEKDKKQLFENCMKESGDLSVKHPKEIEKYCSCSTEGIVKNMSKNEHLENSKKSVKEQMNTQVKFFKHCLDELRETTGIQR